MKQHCKFPLKIRKFASLPFSVDSSFFRIIINSTSKLPDFLGKISRNAMGSPSSKFPAFWSTAFFSCSIHCLTCRHHSKSPPKVIPSFCRRKIQQKTWPIGPKSHTKFPENSENSPLFYCLTLRKIYCRPQSIQRHLEALPGVPGNLLESRWWSTDSQVPWWWFMHCKLKIWQQLQV